MGFCFLLKSVRCGKMRELGFVANRTRKSGFVVLFVFMIFFAGMVPYVSAASPGRIVTGFFSNALSALLKWLWSLPGTTKTAIQGRSMLKFEGGYTVETVFDGSKLGIEPFSVHIASNGDLLVLDSANSNIYRISQPLSRHSRAKLVAGSTEGYSGHVDGNPREARMNHPKGFTVDDRGNIYVADNLNMAIRKISDAGVTTIAGGKFSRGGGHVDGPSEDAKFSNDFEVVYVASSCSLLVVDRGNQAIREIQLHFDDCAYEYGNDFSLGVAVLIGAGFFGYMLALLQRRVGSMVSSSNDSTTAKLHSSSPYQKKQSVRPPLMEDELQKQDNLLISLWKLLVNVGASIAEILGGLFSNFGKKQRDQQQNQYQHHQQQQRRPNVWPLQESFVIPEGEEPPSIETRTPTPRKTYPFMSRDADKALHFRRGRTYYSGWDGDYQNRQQQQLQHHQQHSSVMNTYYKESCESATDEIAFGAVQEQGKRGTVEIKPVDYGDPMYDYHNVRSRTSYRHHL